MEAETDDRFIIPDSLSFENGESGQPKVCMRSSSGHTLEVYLYGGTITSWQSSAGQELLYLSPKADFSGNRPLRGGVPLVFPQFSSGRMLSHGFARSLPWKPIASSKCVDGSVEMSLALSHADLPNTLVPAEIWPYHFELQLAIRLSNQLSVRMTVKNLGSSAFEFQNAFHTYFAVQDISETSVSPLKGLTYLDNTQRKRTLVENDEAVTFSGEVDRVYMDAPDRVILDDGGASRAIAIQKENMRDVVVWNPWEDRSREIKDLPDDAYRKFVCVEVGNIAEPIILTAGESWRCGMVLSCQANS